MKTPFELLKVEETATDAEIKKAYLGMVRRHPPEQCPEQFQRIRTAYEAIRSSEDRISYSLFHCAMPDQEDLFDKILGTVPSNRPDSKWLAAVLGDCLKNYRLPAE